MSQNNKVTSTVTQGIKIDVTPAYIPEQSSPAQQQYIFSYHINIENMTQLSVQLLSRHWIIIDADGNREDVRGPGVVGKTPHIGPNDSFEYTSYCPLQTTWGTMEGSYQMVWEDDQKFDALIGRFILSVPKDDFYH